MSATSTSMERASHDYSPLIIDATNTSKSKVPYTSGVCSVVDSILGGRSKHVGMVCARDGNISGRKRRRAVGRAPRAARPKVSDVPAACKYKKKCSEHEDDTPCVISLGSDDEVEIIDSDPEPPLDSRSTGDRLTDTLPAKKGSDILIVDLCTPSKNWKPTKPTQENMDHKDKKMRGDCWRKCGTAAFQQYVSLLGTKSHTSHNRGHDVATCQGIVSLACPVSASSASETAVKSGVCKIQDCEVLCISSGKGGNLMNNSGISVCSKDVRQSLQAIDNQADQSSAPSSSVYGNNLYNPHPDSVKTGLRPVVIDGSNVAMGHSNGRIFSCRGLQICIDYFLKRKHRVVAFVPQFRKSSCHSQDTAILDRLEKQGLVSFTPSRRIGNQLVVPYDDRYIVQYAAECGGVIVSTDHYRDLIQENPLWRETIENRLLMFTWVGDVLIFPQDPLGRHGPNLENFLRFP